MIDCLSGLSDMTLPVLPILMTSLHVKEEVQCRLTKYDTHLILI